MTIIKEKSVRQKKCNGEIDILIARIGERIQDNYDYWFPDAGPTKELLYDFKYGSGGRHDNNNKIGWEEYALKYLEQLKNNPESQKAVTEILEIAANNYKIVLTCYCKDEKHCHRTLLKEYLESKLKEKLTKEIELIQIRIKRTLSLPVDNLGKPTGAEIDPTMYPPIPLRKIRPEEWTSEKMICKEKIIYFGDPILGSIDYDHELAVFLRKMFK